MDKVYYDPKGLKSKKEGKQQIGKPIDKECKCPGYCHENRRQEGVEDAHCGIDNCKPQEPRECCCKGNVGYKMCSDCPIHGQIDREWEEGLDDILGNFVGTDHFYWYPEHKKPIIQFIKDLLEQQKQDLASKIEGMKIKPSGRHDLHIMSVYKNEGFNQALDSVLDLLKE